MYCMLTCPYFSSLHTDIHFKIYAFIYLTFYFVRWDEQENVTRLYNLSLSDSA